MSASEQVRIRDLEPGDRALWLAEQNGYVIEVERHAQRSTFARVVSDALAGCRIQLSQDAPVEPLP